MVRVFERCKDSRGSDFLAFFYWKRDEGVEGETIGHILLYTNQSFNLLGRSVNLEFCSLYYL